MKTPEKFVSNDHIFPPVQLMQRLLDHSRESFVVVDTDFKISFINSFALEISERVFGKKMTENANAFDFILPERKELFRKILTAVFNGESHYSEIEYSGTNGIPDYHLAIRYIPLEVTPGNITGALIHAQDILKSKKLEVEIEQERWKAKRTLRLAGYRAQEKERAFLGKELHDNVNQILAASRLNLDLAEADSSLYIEYIRKSRTLLLQAVEEIRKLSKGLVISDLVKTGMVPAISSLVKDCCSAGIHVQLKHNKFSETVLSTEIMINLYRILQEQINNILKHSGASRAIVQLSTSEKSVTLRVRDNGTGFDTSLPRTGIGISNIFNRVESLGGHCSIDSTSGVGTVLSVSIPLTGQDLLSQ